MPTCSWWTFQNFKPQQCQVHRSEKHFSSYLEPLRCAPGDKSKARRGSASQEKRISSLVLLLHQFVHRTPWWGVKLRSEAISPSLWEKKMRSNTHYMIAAGRIWPRTKKTEQDSNGNVSHAVFAGIQTVTVYETRSGCIAFRQDGCCIEICVRSPSKLHLVCLDVLIDVFMANSCSV